MRAFFGVGKLCFKRYRANKQGKKKLDKQKNKKTTLFLVPILNSHSAVNVKQSTKQIYCFG